MREGCGEGQRGNACAGVCTRVCVRVGWIGTLSLFQVSTHTQKHPPRPPCLSDSVNPSQRESLRCQPSSPATLPPLTVQLSRLRDPPFILLSKHPPHSHPSPTGLTGPREDMTIKKANSRKFFKTQCLDSGRSPESLPGPIPERWDLCPGWTRQPHQEVSWSPSSWWTR